MRFFVDYVFLQGLQELQVLQSSNVLLLYCNCNVRLNSYRINLEIRGQVNYKYEEIFGTRKKSFNSSKGLTQ